MSERDPRIDPVLGDIVGRICKHREVTRVETRVGGVVRVHWIGDNRSHEGGPSVVGSCSLAAWRRWCRKGGEEVVRAVSDEERVARAEADITAMEERRDTSELDLPRYLTDDPRDYA